MLCCEKIIKSAQGLGVGSLDMYSSYPGVKNFGDGYWNANSQGAKF